MKILAFLFSIGAVALPFCAHSEPFFLEEQLNGQAMLGSADERGALRIITYVGEVVAGDLALPVQIEFSTDQKRLGKALPSGWLVPLFDAYAIAENENIIRVMLPTGHELRFKQSKKDGEFVNMQIQNPDGHGGGWTIEKPQLEKGNFILKNENGASVEYVQGRIERISKGGESLLQWERTADALSVISRDTGRKLASIKSSGDGYIFLIGKDKIELKKSLSIESMSDSIGSIKLNGEKRDEFSYSREKGIAGLNWQSYSAPGLVRSEDYKWIAKNGLLVSDTGYNYKITLAESGFIQKLQRTSKKRGTIETFDVDSKKLTSKVKEASGARQMSFMTAFGGRLRKLDLTKKGKQSIILFSYDENGKLTRTRGEKKADD